MRLALISDIHGNLVALDTVLADAKGEHVDQFVCLGDVAANGPQPREVIQRVRELGCPVVRGNTDEWFLLPQTYDPNSEKERQLMAMLEWAMKQFTADDIAFMQTFRSCVEVTLDHGNTLLCFHGSPQSNTGVILAATPDNDLLQLLGEYRATLMAGGHTHQQLLRQFRDVTIINPGSVGMAFVRGATPRQDRHPAWGEYAIIDANSDQLAIEMRRVSFSVDAIVRAARESGMPNIETWAAGWTK